MFFYYGCIGDSGHYFHDIRGTRQYREMENLIPWKDVDGTLVPHKQDRSLDYEVEGQVALHHKDGWTAIAFCDRSVDSRPGSNSVFLAKGIFSFQDMLTLANKHFPKVIQRQKKPFELVWEDGVISSNRLDLEERARLYDESLERTKKLEAEIKEHNDSFNELADLFGLTGEYRTPTRIVACARSALNQLHRAGGGNVS